MTHTLSTPQPLALTMGEPGGIAPEIAVKAWHALKDEGPTFFVVAPPTLFSDVAATALIENPRDASAAFGNALPVLPLKNNIEVTPGTASPANGPAIIESIERAVGFALNDEAAGVVTNPIHKSSLSPAGFQFPGHTEFLSALTANAQRDDHHSHGPVMMLVGPSLRTVPVTIHLSVLDACASLTTAQIVDKSRTVFQALRNDFGIAAPRLAISGLNPHAGEDGMMGMEDGLIIAPAIDELRANGIDATGPMPADTMFHAEAREKYDAAICMLHDQALIPAKTLAFHDAVNVTLGLPIVRTSPDHGTALAIAGKNEARADSLIAAIKLAEKISASRRIPT